MKIHSLSFKSLGLAMALMSFALVSCQSGVSGLSVNQPTTAQPVDTLPVKTGTAVGEILGVGQARIALLLPKTAPGNGAAVAQQIRNSAELAISDLGSNTMELVIKDTGGTPAGAITATQQAIQEGAAVVIGPVFSSSVTSARSIITQTNRPLIAFSSDPTAAGPGGYLISFLPDQLISKSISYALSQGKTRFTAILPNGAFGTLVERQLRASVNSGGGSLLAVQKYDYTTQSVEDALAAVAESAKSADAIVIPDGRNSPTVITRQLKRLGVDLSQKMLIGTGQWRTSNLKDPNLQGAVFADMDQTRYNIFKQRYLQKFGSEPSANAALGYDAVLLVGGLLREKPGRLISRSDIERRQGFIGASGIFRFLPNGRNERGLAIFKVVNGEAVVTAASPSAF